MPQARSKTFEVTVLPLRTEDEFVDAWKQAHSVGYFGTLTRQADNSLELKLSGPNQGFITGYVNQVLIWNGTALSVTSIDDFLNRYDLI